MTFMHSHLDRRIVFVRVKMRISKYYEKPWRIEKQSVNYSRCISFVNGSPNHIQLCQNHSTVNNNLRWDVQVFNIYLNIFQQIFSPLNIRFLNQKSEPKNLRKMLWYLTLAGRRQLYEDTNAEPSDEEKMSLMQWKFWVEGVLIPAVGLPGLCGRILFDICRYIELS